MSAILKKSNLFVWQKIQEEAVLLDITSGRYYGLNAVGSSFWEKIDGNKTMDEILDLMMEEFEVDRETLREDIEALSKDLVRHKLLDT